MILSRSRWLVLGLALSLCVSGCARTPKRLAPMAPLTPSYPVAAPPQGQTGFYHTVARGETIYRIAKNYGVDKNELMRINRIADPSALAVGQSLFIPQKAAPVLMPASQGPLSYDDIRRRVGAVRSRSVWRTITLHHSGTKQGSAQSFHKNHTRRHMGGLFYHFVIGNGTNTADGGLEVGFRWNRQIKANRPYDIQICLVGDFNEQYVSEAQFSTTAQLVRMLMSDYHIPLSGVRKHEDIKGKHTACPGNHFPFNRLLQELAQT